MSDDLNLSRLKAAAEKATKGEWFEDGIESRDTGQRTKYFVVKDESGLTLADTFNSDAAYLEDDGDGLLIDTVGQSTAEFIVAAQPIVVLALIQCVEALQKALKDSGCDGDLCTYAWHEAAREALSGLHEVTQSTRSGES